jgi:glycosyltransferase involved in cell wall biosynthesis
VRLLIINYVVDDNHAALAWQAQVITELAKRCKYIVVLTERHGSFECPSNVNVYQFKRRPFFIPGRIGGRILNNYQILKVCRENKIDACFVHMAHKWSYLSWPARTMMRVPALLWYAHGNVDWTLKLAIKSVAKIVSSTPEGCNVKTSKLKVIGQGIDVKLFGIPEVRKMERMVYIGRISERKQVLTMVSALASARLNCAELGLDLIGPTLTKMDVQYLTKVYEATESYKLCQEVSYQGHVAISAIPALYSEYFLHLNLSATNSMDKTVLEALACGCPVLTSNPAFKSLLEGYPEMFIDSLDHDLVASRILEIYRKRMSYDPMKLRSLIVGAHDLVSYAGKIHDQLKQICS